MMNRRATVRLAILVVLMGVLLISGWSCMVRMPLKSFAGPLPAASGRQQALADDLRKRVTALAQEIGERNVFLPDKLRMAEQWVEQRLRDTGAEVLRQTYDVSGQACHNLEVEVAGGARKNEIVIVGAHYDSVHGSPGANDNGSGVAVLIELAKVFASAMPARTMRFVAFVNEEPPHFQTDLMGSRVYARRCRERGERVAAMISLETMGYFTDQPGSQKYPFPLAMFYPSKGNFIAFVGNTSSGKLVRSCVEIFRKEAQFPSEGAALPGGLPGVGWSDHWSFWQEKFPAVMVTDTAPFRYPYYHSRQDTPDKLDYERLARVTVGMEKVVAALANPDR